MCSCASLLIQCNFCLEETCDSCWASCECCGMDVCVGCVIAGYCPDCDSDINDDGEDDEDGGW